MSRPPERPEADDARVNDAAFWSQRYRAGRPPWDLGQAASPLERALARVDVAVHPRAFVPGCGHGHEALALARRGHDVVAVDLAAEPIARLAALRQPRLKAVRADLFRLPPAAAGPFDLAVEHCCYCAIEPARRDEYVDVLHGLLRPGAVLLALLFTHGRPGGPPWTTDEDDIRRRFGARFEIVSLETPWDSAPARRGLEALVVMRR